MRVIGCVNVNVQVSRKLGLRVLERTRNNGLSKRVTRERGMTGWLDRISI